MISINHNNQISFNIKILNLIDYEICYKYLIKHLILLL